MEEGGEKGSARGRRQRVAFVESRRPRPIAKAGTSSDAERRRRRRSTRRDRGRTGHGAADHEQEPEEERGERVGVFHLSSNGGPRVSVHRLRDTLCRSAWALFAACLDRNVVRPIRFAHSGRASTLTAV